jgi:hypothetical protein
MSAEPQQKLNLQQRKYIQGHKDHPDFTGYQDKIRGIVGSNIEVEIDWASVEQGLIADSYQNMYLNNGNNIKEWFLLNLEEGIKLICQDKLGKEAVQETIKKIRLVHAPSPSLKMENGIFTVEASLHGGGSYGKEGIKDFLNENL